MTDISIDDLKKRLAELGAHIDAKIEKFHREGALHGAEREAAADWKLQHLRLAGSAGAGERPIGELARDVEILKLAFERWMARIDKHASRSAVSSIPVQ